MSARERIHARLVDLVRFASVSDVSNLDIAAYCEEAMAEAGLAVTRVPSADRAKTSLLATIGDPTVPGIVLSGHMDVVPVEGQDWSVPPFDGLTKDGRVYGRGTSDMKGFLALALAHLPEFTERPLQTPIHIAFSYDEEVGCRGVPDLAAALVAAVAPPVLAIIGEPTSMRIASAHKGKIARRIRVRGRAGHSAMPHRAANAVDAAAEIAVGLAALAREAAEVPGDERFEPGYTTIHVGALHGGSAVNLVPDTATLDFEIRYLPASDPRLFLDRIDALVAAQRAALKARAPEADILVEELSAYPGLDTRDEAAAALLARIAGTDVPPGAVSFGTEGGVFSAAGVPSLVCGPGDIGRAHKADEWIGLDELDDGAAMMSRLASLCRAGI
ncbi:acetylornithine deacetylase [Acuticoccus mangrovi]|uniref:Acetylornithine deacetylase n=1 Tax=Acuticoccus mangrovi TaxID=2796142 RepID=A0A934MCY1_9HYPH|nr:acetylornithine deacetylase [Acuticoccus mangrovi]